MLLKSGNALLVDGALVLDSHLESFMLKNLFVSLASILLLSTFAWAQDHAIHGYIIAPTKGHIDSFEVFLTMRDGEGVIAHASSGAYGEYMFRNVETGNFDILIRQPGFRESRTPIQSGDPERIGGGRAAFISLNILLIPDSVGDAITYKETEYTNSLVEEYGKGLEEISRKHPELAVTHLENVVREVPDFSDARVNLGLVYQDLSRRDDAEKQFRAAIDLKGDSARPFLALGRMYLEDAELRIHSGAAREAIQSKLVQAREALSEASTLDPKSASAFYHLGAVDFRSESYPTAEIELKHALELDPALFPARITLINVFVMQEMWQEALDNADMFLLENPGNPFRKDVLSTRSHVMRKLQSPLAR